ncbi:MAG: hypothetical protein IM542_17275, partial [Pseudanabaena sp. M165S2SP1A06QC]|nr:hypothetical protein [Pseudanabaena sp. M165S2SP1A06QC]
IKIIINEISIKAIAPHLPQTRSPIPTTSNSDRPFITHKTRSPISQNQTAIAPSSPTKPDRLFLQIKQRSPQIDFCKLAIADD